MGVVLGFCEVFALLLGMLLRFGAIKTAAFSFQSKLSHSLLLIGNVRCGFENKVNVNEVVGKCFMWVRISMVIGKCHMSDRKEFNLLIMFLPKEERNERCVLKLMMMNLKSERRD